MSDTTDPTPDTIEIYDDGPCLAEFEIFLTYLRRGGRYRAAAPRRRGLVGGADPAIAYGWTIRAAERKGIAAIRRRSPVRVVEVSGDNAFSWDPRNSTT